MSADSRGSADSSTPQLVRGLGVWDVALITFGTLVGSAIFLAAGIVPREMPQPAILMGLWVLGGLLSIAGVMTYAELGAMFPEAGGVLLVALGLPAYAWWRRKSSASAA